MLFNVHQRILQVQIKNIYKRNVQNMAALFLKQQSLPDNIFQCIHFNNYSYQKTKDYTSSEWSRATEILETSVDGRCRICYISGTYLVGSHVSIY